MSCPVCNQVFATEEVLAAEATALGFVDGVGEDALLLRKLADMTGEPNVAISSN